MQVLTSPRQNAVGVVQIQFLEMYSLLLVHCRMRSRAYIVLSVSFSKGGSNQPPLYFKGGGGVGGWWWCGPVCSAHVSVDMNARDAPKFGERVPVDTTPGTATVCRALKSEPLLLANTAQGALSPAKPACTATAKYRTVLRFIPAMMQRIVGLTSGKKSKPASVVCRMNLYPLLNQAKR